MALSIPALLRRLRRAAGQADHAATVLRLRAALGDARQRRDEARERLARLERPASSAPEFTTLDVFAGEAARAEAAAAIRDAGADPATLPPREAELLLDRIVPKFTSALPSREPPGPDVAFAVVASAPYLPGLEALLRSLTRVYPDLQSPVHVFHDGTIGPQSQRRLERLYGNLHLSVPDMDWLGDLPADSPNHRRVGRLGYTNVMALELTGYRRVVVLDADMLVLDGIAPFWEGEDWVVVPDCGDRDYAVCSPFTGRPVLNSGAIGIPGDQTGPEALAAMQAICRRFSTDPTCATIDRFSDQKAWNIFLKDRPVRWAPVNFNCNIRYVARALGGATEAVSLLHFTGAKPWNDPVYLPDRLRDGMAAPVPAFARDWIAIDRAQRRTERHAAFVEASTDGRRQPRRPGTGRLVLVDGSTPLPETPAVETIASIDALPALGGGAVDHVVIGPEAAGGWTAQEHALPAAWLEALSAMTPRPVLWLAFSLREMAEALRLADRFEVNWLLAEEPFRRRVDQVGRYDPDPAAFLDDARNDAITFGVPAARLMGLPAALALAPSRNDREVFIRDLVAQAIR